MSYGVGRGVFRQVASHYVGKILKGAKPNDLPIQQVLSRFVLELGDAISGISRVPSQAARSIG